MFATDPILPSDPGGPEVLHDREYRVRAYRTADDELLVRGAVRDQKPPGLFFADDPEPLVMHHMQVELRVAFPSMRIIGAEVLFEAHPHTSCPRIIDHYQELVGLSIARGFTHEVRQRFGGPRGCTHTTALLLAMAPVAVQCTWSMQAVANRDADVGPGRRPAMSGADRQRMEQANTDTCHVWAADGEQLTAAIAGEPIEIPLTIQRRLDDLGRDPSEWPARPQ